MELKSFQCRICSNWIMKTANHCSHCGSTVPINRKHYDYSALLNGRMIEVARGIPVEWTLKEICES